MITINNLENLKTFENLIFGERISYIIELKGISKTWLADQIGISKQALNYLLKHSIKPKFIDEFAEILQINPLWLEKGIGQPGFVGMVQTLKNTIHILSKRTLLGEIDQQQWGEVEFSSANLENFIAYKLEDNSNFPPFIEGSILIFDKCKLPSNNDYVLSIIDKDVYVRQYIIDEKNICYKAATFSHKTYINPTAKILGTLVEARYKIN